MTSLDLMQYRALVEHSPTMVWRAGLDTRCDYFNATWLAFTGRTLEQEAGNGWAEGIHPEDMERCLSIYLSSFAARTPFEMEYRLRRADGSFRYLFDRGVPYTDHEGAFAGYIGSCVDIDDRRRADEARQTFLTMIAHELRTPLMTFQTSATLLRRRLAAGKDVEPTLASIERQINRFSKMVASLSEVSGPEAGYSLTIDAAPMDIWQLLRDTVEAHEEALRVHSDHPHTLTVDAPTTALEVHADSDRLRRVLLNLIENAIKYSPHGGNVAVRGEVVDGGVALSVSDSGIGIPEADQPLVTRRFFRAGNAAPENFPGVGLGLSIAKEIIEAHGGKLSLQSKVGHGTTVTLTLPVGGRGAQS
ncbi:MAG: PAS domain-containing sensor histidine kinase [Byssovorax sp.]